MATLFKLNKEQHIEFAPAYSLSSLSANSGPIELTEDIVKEINKLNPAKKRFLMSKMTDDEVTVILTNKTYATKLRVTDYLGMKVAIVDELHPRTVIVFLLEEISHFKEDGCHVNVFRPISGSFELFVDSEGLFYE